MKEEKIGVQWKGEAYTLKDFSQTCGGPHLARNCPSTVGIASAAARSNGVICRNCGGENQ